MACRHIFQAVSSGYRCSGQIYGEASTGVGLVLLQRIRFILVPHDVAMSLIVNARR
jgi:hypothetical protein